MIRHLVLAVHVAGAFALTPGVRYSLARPTTPRTQLGSRRALCVASATADNPPSDAADAARARRRALDRRAARLAAPALAGLVISPLLSLIDTFYVGRFCDRTSALGAVATAPPRALALALAGDGLDGGGGARASAAHRARAARDAAWRRAQHDGAARAAGEFARAFGAAGGHGSLALGLAKHSASRGVTAAALALLLDIPIARLVGTSGEPAADADAPPPPAGASGASADDAALLALLFGGEKPARRPGTAAAAPRDHAAAWFALLMDALARNVQVRAPARFPRSLSRSLPRSSESPRSPRAL